MNDTTPLYAGVGLSGGFTLGALLEWSRSPSTIGAAAFIGSVASTVLGWYLARRREIARANLEIQRDLWNAERDKRFADALAEIALQAERSRAEAGRPPVG